MTKRFCCCIPVRFGVFVISLLATIFSGLSLAGALYILLGKKFVKTRIDPIFTTAPPTDQGKDNVYVLNGSTRPAFIVLAVYYGIVTLVSLIGFVGSIGRKRGLIALYGQFLWGALLVHVALAGYSIFRIVHDFEPASQQICRDNTAHTDCISVNASKAVYISVLVVGTLIFLYGAIIVNRYKDQLDEDSAKSWAANPNYTKEAFYSGPPVPESHPLTAPYSSAPYNDIRNTAYHQVGPSDYPYAAEQHSYGKQV